MSDLARRDLLLLGVSAAGLALVGRALETRWLSHDDLVDLVLATLPSLTIPRAEVERYVDDLLAAFERPTVEELQKVERFLRVVPYSHEPGIAERFLLSSDFFQQGADPSRPVRYLALNDPYLTPCLQPFPAPG
ncbi:MAG: hypothetical protein H6732_18360 [Alphaproteobacteria bacterium]|nr:hypothetical protein [Alphaproteobacteria bacterium]